MTLVTWGVILLLILVTSLYVAAEFGAVGVRRSRVRALAEDGNLFARRLLPIIEDAGELDRYIAASQIGITLSSLLLGAYGQSQLTGPLEPLLVRLFDVQPVAARSAAAAIVLIGLTTLGLILGELVPKSLALQYPTRTALATVLPMQWSRRVFAWFITVLNGSGVLVLKWLGVPTTGNRHIHSPEELELLFVESRDGGLLEPEEQIRLHRALRLGLRSARQLMVPRPRVAALDIDTPPAAVLDAVTASPYTRIPLYRGSIDGIVGILHTKDLVLHYVGDGAPPDLARIMHPVVSVPETMEADRLLSYLRERRSHQAIVVDEHGKLAGFVTLEDVLAELLGEVADEFKTGRAKAQRLPGAVGSSHG